MRFFVEQLNEFVKWYNITKYISNVEGKNSVINGEHYIVLFFYDYLDFGEFRVFILLSELNGLPEIGCYDLIRTRFARTKLLLAYNQLTNAQPNIYEHMNNNEMMIPLKNNVKAHFSVDDLIKDSKKGIINTLEAFLSIKF